MTVCKRPRGLVSCPCTSARRCGAPPRLAARPQHAAYGSRVRGGRGLLGGRAYGTKNPWHNRPTGRDGLSPVGREAIRVYAPVVPEYSYHVRRTSIRVSRESPQPAFIVQPRRLRSSPLPLSTC